MWWENCASFADSKQLCNFQVQKQTCSILSSLFIVSQKPQIMTVNRVLCYIDLQIRWLDCVSITLRSQCCSRTHRPDNIPVTDVFTLVFSVCGQHLNTGHMASERSQNFSVIKYSSITLYRMFDQRYLVFNNVLKALEQKLY